MQRDFIFGASTSAHQVEGFNTNDWSEWEKVNAKRLATEAPHKFEHLVPDWQAIKSEATNPDNYISGSAVDHWHRFSEDVLVMRDLGIKAYRFSIEWSRMEPLKGYWDEEAIDHYAKVIDELKSNGIEPWVTLWHRTNPLWIKNLGDWSNSKTVQFYLRFVDVVVSRYGEKVKYWMPLNEPVMSMGGGYLTGEYPPNRKNIFVAYKVLKNFVSAHNGAYKLIHSKLSEVYVGMPHAAFYLEAYKGKMINKTTVKLGHYFANWLILNKVRKYCDFIGVQYYTRGLVDWFRQVPGDGRKTDMGWEIYPKGLYKFMKLVWERYRLPMVVTENGVTDAKDEYRAWAIEAHLDQVFRARDEGVDVRGYFYWSLLDNLEWDKGFWPKFGLVSVNRATMERTVRESARKYKEIISQRS